MYIQIGTLVMDYLPENQVRTLEGMLECDIETVLRSFIEVDEGDESKPLSVDTDRILSPSEILLTIEEGDRIVMEEDYPDEGFVLDLEKRCLKQPGYWTNEVTFSVY